MALEKRDRAALEAAVSPVIRHTSGAEPQTRVEFFKSWGATEPWKSLGSELRRGGGWQGDKFCCNTSSLAIENGRECAIAILMFNVLKRQSQGQGQGQGLGLAEGGL